MIKYIKGNLLDTDCEMIAHGVNCIGGFGSGIAGQIAHKYPLVKRAYLRKFNDGGWKLGDVQFVVQHGKIFVNCATQKDYGEDNKIRADYFAISKVMRKLYAYSAHHNKRVAIPKIGAGLANGSWPEIEKRINEIFHDRDIFVYVLT